MERRYQGRFTFFQGAATRHEGSCGKSPGPPRMGFSKTQRLHKFHSLCTASEREMIECSRHMAYAGDLTRSAQLKAT